MANPLCEQISFTEKSEYIYNHSSVGESVSARIKQMELSELVLKDAKTGAKFTDEEWSYAEYDGKIVVNMINYNRKIP